MRRLKADSALVPRIAGFLALASLAGAAFLFSYNYFANAAPVETQAAAVATPNSFEGISLIGKSAIVVDLATGHTLFERNADTQLPLASITKVPLMLVVSSVLNPSSSITIPYDTAPIGSSERLGAGEVWPLKDVIKFTLVISSNEGAEILAAAANSAVRAKYPQAPAAHATLWRMNDLMRELGLTHTYFLNVSGLDESATQSGAYGTAREVARIFAYAASTSPQTFSATTKGDLLLSNTEGDTTSAYNTNEALGEIPGLIMGKTGYTDLAGGNLAVVFDVGLAHPVVAVVLGSTQEGRFTDMKTLVARARDAVSHE
jgi:D-alanyl-D-alanine carboxypeptidase (penicillin-binding protein 5/6)